MYILFLWASRIMPKVPGWLLRWLAAVIAPLVWLCALPARKRATANAVHVLGTEILATRAGRRRLHRIVRGMFYTNVRNYLEAFALPGMSGEELLGCLTIENEEVFHKVLQQGKGVLLFSVHLGPFEYLSQWFAVKGYPCVIPVEPLKDERLLKLWVGLRSSQGVKFLPLGGSAPMRAILQALRQNQIVLLAADRAIVGESEIHDFFGTPA